MTYRLDLVMPYNFNPSEPILMKTFSDSDLETMIIEPANKVKLVPYDSSVDLFGAARSKRSMKVTWTEELTKDLRNINKGGGLKTIRKRTFVADDWVEGAESDLVYEAEEEHYAKNQVYEISRALRNDLIPFTHVSVDEVTWFQRSLTLVGKDSRSFSFGSKIYEPLMVELSKRLRGHPASYSDAFYLLCYATKEIQ